MKNYSLKYCENLIDKYINEYEGEMLTITEGILGLGKVILYNAHGKKSIIITEYFINSWTSGHKIRMYNKLPKKYKQIINNQ